MDGDKSAERSPPVPPSEPGDAPVTEILAGAERTEPAHRIFVNRHLRFADIEHIGFDMDYTLAPYAKRELEALSFELTKARMVKEMGYPEEILALPYDSDFAVRGLAIDKRLGNILEINRHGYVSRAYHGRVPLDRDARHRAYRQSKVRLAAARYHWVDTLFALPEVALYAEVIDLYEKGLGRSKVDYEELFEDIRSAIDACHRDGSLKTEITRDLGRYLITDPALPQTLHALRLANKRLFVLTNSEWSYTDRVMRHLLDEKLAGYPSWRDYFDFVIVEAKKPDFFTESLPFHRVDPATGEEDPGPACGLEPGEIYRGGSTRELARRRPDLHGERVLYVGDHIYGDIIRSKRDTMWRTALVLEELEHELLSQRSLQIEESAREALEERVSLLSEHLRVLARRLAELGESPREREGLEFLVAKKRRELDRIETRRREISERIDRSFNKYWGSVFRAGNDLSRFGRQVEEYACIYTSRVSNLLGYAPTQYFRSPRHWLPHEKSA